MLDCIGSKPSAESIVLAQFAFILLLRRTIGLPEIRAGEFVVGDCILLLILAYGLVPLRFRSLLASLIGLTVLGSFSALVWYSPAAAFGPSALWVYRALFTTATLRVANIVVVRTVRLSDHRRASLEQW